MRWEDEQYIRFYKRNTPEWLALSWQARGLFGLLMREVDRAGILEVGPKLGLRGVAVAIRASWDEVKDALAELLEDGCVAFLEREGIVHIPNFLAAQEVTYSDVARKQKSREVARARAMAAGLGLAPEETPPPPVSPTRIDENVNSQATADAVTNRDISSRAVTESHAPSRAVTSGHSDLVCTVPSCAVPSESARAHEGTREGQSQPEVSAGPREPAPLESGPRMVGGRQPLADDAEFTEAHREILEGLNMTSGAQLDPEIEWGRFVADAREGGKVSANWLESWRKWCWGGVDRAKARRLKTPTGAAPAAASSPRTEAFEAGIRHVIPRFAHTWAPWDVRTIDETVEKLARYREDDERLDEPGTLRWLGKSARIFAESQPKTLTPRAFQAWAMNREMAQSEARKAS